MALEQTRPPSSADSGPNPAEFIYSGRRYLEVIKAAKHYNELLWTFVEREVKPCDDVLDFGAGQGTLALRLVERARSVTCVEPDAEFQSALRGGGLPCASDLSGIPQDSVDFIYALNVLEHIDDDQGILRDFHATLRDGGRLVVYVPAFLCLYNSMDKASGHVRRYRRRQVEQLLRATGFTVERVEYVDSLGFAATLLWKLFDDGSGSISSGPIYFYDRYLFWLSRVLDLALHNLVGKNVLALAAKGQSANRSSSRQ